MTTSFSVTGQKVVDAYGAIIRSDTSVREVYLCFTGHDHVDGFDHVLKVLKDHNIPASFFLTGDFIRAEKDLVMRMFDQGHYVGAHSDKHLLYCDWIRRDSLLHSPSVIREDIRHNLDALHHLGIDAQYFMPPYEWYNQQVVELAKELDQITVNFSPGTRSNGDYTTPEMPNYITSDEIISNIHAFEKSNGMNGFHLLIHPGTDPKREDKLYLRLDEIISYLKGKEYQFARF